MVFLLAEMQAEDWHNFAWTKKQLKMNMMIFLT